VNCQYGQDCAVGAQQRQNSAPVRTERARGREQSYDGVVVCAGVGSRALARQLGDRLNVYPVKGYSITVNLLDDGKASRAAPTVSLLDDETKLVTSRLGEDRFSVAGTAEFNGVNRDIRADRIRPLVDWVQQCFPGVSTRQVEPWAGLRPMMPDMMPKRRPWPPGQRVLQHGSWTPGMDAVGHHRTPVGRARGAVGAAAGTRVSRCEAGAGGGGVSSGKRFECH
jgi:D-amino-acid dehydrogenase